jgi:hypothetical protein
MSVTWSDLVQGYFYQNEMIGEYFSEFQTDADCASTKELQQILTHSRINVLKRQKIALKRGPMPDFITAPMVTEIDYHLAELVRSRDSFSV